MTTEQMLITAVLAATVAMFLWGRWRHDMVALAALIACVLAGLVPAADAFAGFGHPAVITVACVLVLSRGLQASGAIDALTRRILPSEAPPLATLAILTGTTAALSGVMNNVGALAMMMPVALQAANRAGWPPGRMLMPLAFGSILGGMTTLIGTPPNLIVSAFRADALGQGFAMFDFFPVGIVVAITGIAFVTLIGWRLVPERARSGVAGFEAGAYMAEARVADGAKAVGMSLAEIEDKLEAADAQVLGLIRREVRLRAPRRSTRLRADDILVLEAEPDALTEALSTLGLDLVEAVDPDGEGAENGEDDAEGGGKAKGDKDKDTDRSEDNEVALIELVVLPGAVLIGRSSSGLNLRQRYHINLLALSRQGRRTIRRLRDAEFRAGDVLLVQGAADTIAEFASDHGCLPLAERPLRLPDHRRLVIAVAIFATAVALAATGLVLPAIAFAGGVLAVMATGVVPPRVVYEAIDWPVVVLLACMLPVAGALQATGTADLVARQLIGLAGADRQVLALALILVMAMTLSDLMNNAATVAVMAPIALGLAAGFDANPDAFLMAVAIGGSCAFLTPIGHQNNTLILGPGGFRFGDYWRLGLPLEAIVVAVAVPMIVVVWGL
jgi:di/tricarboxylate transporter